MRERCQAFLQEMKKIEIEAKLRNGNDFTLYDTNLYINNIQPDSLRLCVVATVNCLRGRVGETISFVLKVSKTDVPQYMKPLIPT